jgi:hypothetical protein
MVSGLKKLSKVRKWDGDDWRLWAIRLIDNANVPWKWRRRALAAEAKLRREQSSMMSLVLRVNGEYVTTYWVKATRLESASESLDSGSKVEAYGDGAAFTIDIPVEVNTDSVKVERR